MRKIVVKIIVLALLSVLVAQVLNVLPVRGSIFLGTEIKYDDGSSEDRWNISPAYKVGVMFTKNDLPFSSNLLVTVEIYLEIAANDTQQLTMFILDSNFTEIMEGAIFTPALHVGWNNIDVSDYGLVFDDAFLIAFQWLRPDGERTEVWLGYDFDTPENYVHSYEYNEAKWPPPYWHSPSDPTGDQGEYGNWMIRAVVEAASITVSNVVQGVPPDSDWNYILMEGETVLEQFSLPAIGGGTFSFTSGTGGDYLVAQTKKFDYDTSITVNEAPVPIVAWDNMDAVSLNLKPGDKAFVVFNNVMVPDSAWARSASGSDPYPPVKMAYNIPCRVPIPVQVSWDPDIQPDGRLDLVKGRPTTILVNLTDVLAPTGPIALNDSVTISVTSTSGFFDFPLKVTTGQGIKDSSIIFFTANPPNFLGDDTITCTITYGPTQSTLGPYTTNVSLKETSKLSLYYSYLYRKDSSGSLIDYGTEPTADYDTMFTNTRDFINIVYPVPQLTVASNPQGLAGSVVQPNYLGMLKDCQYIAQQAKLRFPNDLNVIGVAIGPNSTFGQKYQSYFVYHGAVINKRTAVGVSFGPGTKGVVVMDGYYSAAAHEVAHTFGLYYGVPEQYLTYNPGMPSNGFYPAQNQWRAGYDFMGLSPYKSTTNIWTNTTSTFQPLFRSLKTPNDPQILLVNGIIYKNGSVELPFTWYSMAVGTPDTVPQGDFALRFIAPDEVTILGETSFDAKFCLNLDPGIRIGEDLPDVSGFGSIETDFAGFAFATIYPPGTATIQLVDKRNPDNPLKSISAADVVEASFSGFIPPINNDGTSVFKRGTTIPVKFQLKSSLGTFVATATARLYIAKIDSNGVPGTDQPGISASSAVIDNLFRYDLIKNQYIFDLSAKSMSAGQWQIKVKFADGTEKTVRITIK